MAGWGPLNALFLPFVCSAVGLLSQPGPFPSLCPPPSLCAPDPPGNFPMEESPAAGRGERLCGGCRRMEGGGKKKSPTQGQKEAVNGLEMQAEFLKSERKGGSRVGGTGPGGEFSPSSQGPLGCSGNCCLVRAAGPHLVLCFLCRVPTVPVKNLNGSSPVNPALAGEDGPTTEVCGGLPHSLALFCPPSPPQASRGS